MSIAGRVKWRLVLLHDKFGILLVIDDPPLLRDKAKGFLANVVAPHCHYYANLIQLGV